jgi:hypothetical protein
MQPGQRFSARPPMQRGFRAAGGRNRAWLRRGTGCRSRDRCSGWGWRSPVAGAAQASRGVWIDGAETTSPAWRLAARYRQVLRAAGRRPAGQRPIVSGVRWNGASSVQDNDFHAAVGAPPFRR